MVSQGVVASKFMFGVAIAASLVAFAGCESGPKPKPKVVQSDLPPVEPALRGLIGSEVQFRNVTPTLVSGYGVVVGLNGTGGLELNDAGIAEGQVVVGHMGTPVWDLCVIVEL